MIVKEEKSYDMFTKSQKYIWFYYSCFPDSTNLYSTCNVIIDTNIEREKWILCTKQIIRQYDVFEFGVDKNGNFYELEKKEKEKVEIVEFDELEGEKYQTWLNQINRISLTEGALYKIYMYRYGETYGMVFILHAMIGDEIFSRKIIHDIYIYYLSGCYEGIENILKKRIKYEKLYKNSEKWKQNKYFWSNYLDGITQVNKYIPLKRKSFQRNYFFEENLSQSIRVFCKSNDITEASFFYSLYFLEYHIVNGEKNILLGIFPVLSEEDNRDYFVRPCVPLRMQLSGNMSIIDLIKKTDSYLKKCIQNIDFSYYDIVNMLNNKYGHTVSIIDSLMYFIQDNMPENISYIPLPQQDINCSLQIRVYRQENKYQISFDFADESYNEQEADYCVERYFKVAEIMLNDIEAKIKDICLLNSDEMFYYMNRFNCMQTSNIKKNILDLWDERVNNYPLQIVARDGNKIITCKELDKKAILLAKILIGRGIKKQLVGISMEHSIDLLIALLGILKAGCAYVPIDANYPPSRLNYIIHDASINVILTSNLKLERIKQLDCIKLCIDDFVASDIQHTENVNVEINIDNHDPVYIIYTSGSTGNPKGVIVEHQCLMNYISWAKKTYLVANHDAVPLYSSLAFDLTVTSIFLPLVSGTEIIIYNDVRGKNVFEKIISDNRITFIKITPTHLYMLQHLLHYGLKLKKIVIGGEQLTTALAKSVYDALGGDVEIYNEYGPTEATVGCMIHRYNPSNDTGYAVPIGNPIDNTKIFLLDQYGNILPKGVNGEIYIAGDGIARGYLNQPKLTRQFFYKQLEITNGIMYRTGDIGRFVNCDTLVYVGRKDSQCKIRGNRIEISEIEKKLEQIKEINKAIVITCKDCSDSTHLCAYYEAKRALKDEVLRDKLLQILPFYMIPTYFVWVKSFSYTVNGKINIDQLQKQRKEIEVTKVLIFPNITNLLLNIATEILHKNIDLESDFFEQGGNSMDAIRMCIQLHEFGYFIKPHNIYQYSTFREIAILIQNNLLKNSICNYDIRENMSENNKFDLN